MRSGLGSLPILLAMGPPVLVGVALMHVLMVIAGIGLIAIVVPLVIVFWILQRELREAEEDLRAAGIDLSVPAIAIDDAKGKRPGQFGISGLFVLMTLAAFAFAIIRLPIPVPGKIFALLALWFGFQFWQLRNFKLAASSTGRFNMEVTNLVGQAIMIAMYAWSVFGIGRRPPSYVTFIFFGFMAIGPALGIWRSVNAMRQAISAGKNRPAV